MSKDRLRHPLKAVAHYPGNISADRGHLVFLCALTMALALLFPALAGAEKADKEKPVNIESDKLHIDDAKKESVFEGHVVLTQGTLVLRADRVVVKQDAQGFNYGFAYGKPAYFKQKREGFDEYIEGNAERLEYDGRRDKMQMFTNAEIHKGNDEVKGDYISYDAVTEFYQVIGGPSVATAVNPKGRVRATIQPPKKAVEKPAVGAEGNVNPPPVQLKSSGPLQ